jgi:hypothetical protein
MLRPSIPISLQIAGGPVNVASASPSARPPQFQKPLSAISSQFPFLPETRVTICLLSETRFETTQIDNRPVSLFASFWQGFLGARFPITPGRGVPMARQWQQTSLPSLTNLGSLLTSLPQFFTRQRNSMRAFSNDYLPRNQ